MFDIYLNVSEQCLPGRVFEQTDNVGVVEVYYIVLTVAFRQEEGVWTAECHELGTATFGDTFEEAEQNISEAIELHLNTLEKVGERERFFRENNIKILKKLPQQKRVKVLTNFNTFVTRRTQPIYICLLSYGWRTSIGIVSLAQ